MRDLNPDCEKCGRWTNNGVCADHECAGRAHFYVGYPDWPGKKLAGLAVSWQACTCHSAFKIGHCATPPVIPPGAPEGKYKEQLFARIGGD